jgi:hypothetical protein
VARRVSAHVSALPKIRKTAKGKIGKMRRGRRAKAIG